MLAARLVVEGPVSLTKPSRNAIKKKLLNHPTTTAKQLKKTMPELANMSMGAIQHVSLKKLKLHSGVMGKKPLLTQRMKDQRLEFVHQRPLGGEEWKQVVMRAILSCDLGTRAPAAGGQWALTGMRRSLGTTLILQSQAKPDRS